MASGAQYLPTGGEGGVPQWLGVYYGYIAVNQDPLDSGRVKLRVPQVFGNTTSGWAAPMVPLSYVPAVGTQVTVMFVGGDPTQPVWFGNFAIPSTANNTSGTGTPPSDPSPVPAIGSIYYQVDANNTVIGMFEWNGAGWVDYYIGGVIAPGNNIYANPDANTLFTIQPPNLSGTFESVFQLSTPDANQTQPATLGSLLLDPGHQGTTAKQSMILTSPFASEGAAMVLEGQNDAGTDTPQITLGAVTDQGGSMVFSPTATFFGYGSLFYAGSAQQVVKTFTSSGTWTAPTGVTSVKVEAWAPSGGGAAGAFGYGGPGGGGGEYAAEPANTCVPADVYTITIGSAGNNGTFGSPNGTNGGNASFSGTSATTVTAHGGKGATAATSKSTPGTAGLAGTGSANTIHFPGGAGGSSNTTTGGGGGASGGTSGAGRGGFSGANGGAGGPASAGSSPGGNAGTASLSSPDGQAGTAPGGAGGGGGYDPVLPEAFPGGAGSGGMVRLTYNLSASSLLASLATAPGTDQFGISYPAGWNISLGLAGGKIAQFQNTTANPSAPSVLIEAAQAGDVSFGITTTGNNFVTYKQDSNGQQYWGAGNASQDTHLYRSASGQLATEQLVASVSGAAATWQSLGTTLQYTAAEGGGNPTAADYTVNLAKYRMMPDATVLIQLDITFNGSGVTNPTLLFPNQLPAAYQPAGNVDIRCSVTPTNSTGTYARFFVGSAGGSSPGQVQLAGFTSSFNGTYSAQVRYPVI